MNERSSERERSRRPTVNDVDPHVLAVNAIPDDIRVRGNADETQEVLAAGDQLSTREVESGEEK
jgi:hypothetical protein